MRYRSVQRSQVRLWPTVQPINGSTIPISRPRTSRDAGPYLARMAFAGGKGLAVGGWAEEAEGRADRPRSAGARGIRARDRRQGQGKKIREDRRGIRCASGQPFNRSTNQPPMSRRRTSRDAGPYRAGNTISRPYASPRAHVSPCPRVPYSAPYLVRVALVTLFLAGS
jgi:hypothetical protein